MFVQHSFSKVGFKFKQKGEKKEREGRCFYTRLCNLCYKSMFSWNLRFRPTSKCFYFTNTFKSKMWYLKLCSKQTLEPKALDVLELGIGGDLRWEQVFIEYNYNLDMTLDHDSKIGPFSLAVRVFSWPLCLASCTSREKCVLAFA